MTNPTAVLYGPHDVRIEDRPVPRPGPGQLLVEIGATGICGFDVHCYEHGRIGDFVVREPMVIGHESAGTVVDAGDDAGQARIGELVALEPGLPCRRCEQCLRGRYNLCPQVRFFATPPIDGSISRFVAVDAAFAHAAPAGLSAEHAARGPGRPRVRCRYPHSHRRQRVPARPRACPGTVHGTRRRRPRSGVRRPPRMLRGGGGARRWPARPGPGRPSSPRIRPRESAAATPGESGREYVILAEYGDGVTRDELVRELDDWGSEFDSYRPVILTRPTGGSEIQLTVFGADVWMSILAAMAVITRTWHEPSAVHVMTSGEFGDRDAA